MEIMIPKTDVPAPHFLNTGSLLNSFPVIIDYLCDKRISDSHWHDFVQLWYTVSGEYYHTINGITCKQTPGSLAIVPPFAIHQIDSSQSDLSSLRVIKCEFAFDVFQKNQLDFKPLNYISIAFSKMQLTPFLKISGTDKEKVDILFYDMVTLFYKDFNRNSSKIFSLTDKALEYFAKNQPKLSPKEINIKSASAVCINNAVSFMTINSSRKITVDEASGYAVMSRRSFLEYFKQVTGTTCHEYLTSVRIKKALNKMRCSNLTMSEISDICGFSNSAHFSKTISSTFNLSPTDLKKVLNDWDSKYFDRHWESRKKNYLKTGNIFIE